MKDLSVVTDQNLTAWLLVGRLTMLASGVRPLQTSRESPDRIQP
jgi:hypothetical protein